MSLAVTSEPISAADALARASALGDTLLKRGAEIDEGRSLPQDIVDTMRRDGLVGISMPRELGGSELNPMAQLGVLERVARGNASAAWVLMIATDNGYWSSWVPKDIAREVWSSPDMLSAGQFRPRKTQDVEEVAGGYRITAGYAFGSGINHAEVVVGGCNVERADGPPELRVMIYDRADVTIEDVWHTTGLRGTGSNDYRVTDAFVPKERTFTIPPTVYRDEPLYAAPHSFSDKFCGVALGMSQAAVDEAIHYFTDVAPPASRESEAVQIAIAEAVWRLRSARLFVCDALESSWQRRLADQPESSAQIAHLHLANARTFTAARDIILQLSTLLGSRSIYAGNRIEELRRDILTACAHVGTGERMMRHAGRRYLGMPSGHEFY